MTTERFRVICDVICQNINVISFWGVYKVVLVMKDKHIHYSCARRDGSQYSSVKFSCCVYACRTLIHVLPDKV
jgi:hypothetical protein